MLAGLIKGLFAAGFFATYVGFATLMLPMLFRFLRGPWRQAVMLPHRDRIQFLMPYLSQEFRTVGKTRAGHWGQMLLAIGVSLMMVAGVIWLGSKIVARYC